MLTSDAQKEVDSHLKRGSTARSIFSRHFFTEFFRGISVTQGVMQDFKITTLLLKGEYPVEGRFAQGHAPPWKFFKKHTQIGAF